MTLKSFFDSDGFPYQVFPLGFSEVFLAKEFGNFLFSMFWCVQDESSKDNFIFFLVVGNSRDPGQLKQLLGISYIPGRVLEAIYVDKLLRYRNEVLDRFYDYLGVASLRNFQVYSFR